MLIKELVRQMILQLNNNSYLTLKEERRITYVFDVGKLVQKEGMDVKEYWRSLFLEMPELINLILERIKLIDHNITNDVVEMIRKLGLLS